MTAQVPDEIIYEGETLALLSNPLENYQGPSKAKLKFYPPHTANWRGYVAVWQIQGNQLFLIDISGQLADRTPANFKDVFVEIDGDKKLPATWYSGTLRIAKGELIKYVHMGYYSTYEQELFITIENGIVTNTFLVDNSSNEDAR